MNIYVLLINGEYVRPTHNKINNIFINKVRIYINSIFYTDCIALMYGVIHYRIVFITILVLSRYKEGGYKILNLPPKNHTWFTKTFITFFIWDWQFFGAPVEAKFVLTSGSPDEIAFTKSMQTLIYLQEVYYIHQSQIFDALQFHLVWQCFQCSPSWTIPWRLMSYWCNTDGWWE